ncbi:hypothetical protein OFM39_35790, partial [Escherichia coli]|nr:hypothetical protein [Escherichia coli]
MEIIKGKMEMYKQEQIMLPLSKLARIVERPSRENASGEHSIVTPVAKANIFSRIVRNRKQHRWDNFCYKTLHTL